MFQTKINKIYERLYIYVQAKMSLENCKKAELFDEEQGRKSKKTMPCQLKDKCRTSRSMQSLPPKSQHLEVMQKIPQREPTDDAVNKERQFRFFFPFFLKYIYF